MVDVIFYQTHVILGQTSCGLTLKILRKTPIYTCGSHLVMVVPSTARAGQPSAFFVPNLSVPGPSTKGAYHVMSAPEIRVFRPIFTLFTPQSHSSLPPPMFTILSDAPGIATSLCFSLIDGMLDQKVDLTDAPGCALAKGSSLSSMGEFDQSDLVI